MMSVNVVYLECVPGSHQYYLLELAWWRHDMETLLLLMNTGAYVASNAELRSKYRCESEQTV